MGCPLACDGCASRASFLRGLYGAVARRSFLGLVRQLHDQIRDGVSNNGKQVLGKLVLRFFCFLLLFALAVHAQIPYMIEATQYVHWRVTPKFHLFLHVVEDQAASMGSPTSFWTYADEREIGRAVPVAAAQHPATFNKAVMQRYRLW